VKKVVLIVNNVKCEFRSQFESSCSSHFFSNSLKATVLEGTHTIGSEGTFLSYHTGGRRFYARSTFAIVSHSSRDRIHRKHERHDHDHLKTMSTTTLLEKDGDSDNDDDNNKSQERDATKNHVDKLTAEQRQALLQDITWWDYIGHQCAVGGVDRWLVWFLLQTRQSARIGAILSRSDCSPFVCT
jgi:hypothetical protein